VLIALSPASAAIPDSGLFAEETFTASTDVDGYQSAAVVDFARVRTGSVLTAGLTLGAANLFLDGVKAAVGDLIGVAHCRDRLREYGRLWVVKADWGRQG